jgi:hypothetical protein
MDWMPNCVHSSPVVMQISVPDNHFFLVISCLSRKLFPIVGVLSLFPCHSSSCLLLFGCQDVSILPFLIPLPFLSSFYAMSLSPMLTGCLLPNPGHALLGWHSNLLYSLFSILDSMVFSTNANHQCQ